MTRQAKAAAQPSATAAPRPSKPERDELRRDEIVAAARACVLRHGFHAASMQQIAAEAHMSVGQIYRYFPNKEAIIYAIVERIVEQRLQWIDSTALQDSLPAILATRMLGSDATQADDHALLLEVTAEGTRNPKVAEIVKAADLRMHARALAAVKLDYPHLSAKEAAARVEFMAVLSEGTAFRRLTDQPADTKTLQALYRQVIESLLPSNKPGKKT